MRLKTKKEPVKTGSVHPLFGRHGFIFFSVPDEGLRSNRVFREISVSVFRVIIGKNQSFYPFVFASIRSFFIVHQIKMSGKSFVCCIQIKLKIVFKFIILVSVIHLVDSEIPNISKISSSHIHSFRIVCAVIINNAVAVFNREAVFGAGSG